MRRTSVKRVVAVAGLFAVMGSAQADVGVGVRYSTLGAGVELGTSFSDFFSLRLGLNKYTTSENQTIDNIQYDADVDFQSTSLLLDWNPFGGSFHVTAGYLSSDNEIRALATPSGTVAIGNTPVTVSAGDLVLNSTIKLGSGPYLGLGWGNVPASGFGFVLEAGVVQMGTPDVSLTLSGTNTALIDALYATGDVNQEIANMESDLDEYDTYPVIAVGISYGF